MSSDSAFTGSIPDIYDRSLGPLLFNAYGEALAKRVAPWDPADLLETAAGTGIATGRNGGRGVQTPISVVHSAALQRTGTDNVPVLTQPLQQAAGVQDYSSMNTPSVWRSGRTAAAKVDAPGGVDFARILNPKPGDWVTYNGNVSGNRYSPLDQINQKNVNKLALQ